MIVGALLPYLAVSQPSWATMKLSLRGGGPDGQVCAVEGRGHVCDLSDARLSAEEPWGVHPELEGLKQAAVDGGLCT